MERHESETFPGTRAAHGPTPADAPRGDDVLAVAGRQVRSRLFLGTARYPSPAHLRDAVVASGADVVTVSLRRESGGERAGQAFWDLVAASGAHVLPNTAGCHTVREAVLTAHMARELFGTTWIKLEVVGHAETLQPDPFALVEAARILCGEGFDVFPYTTEDLIVAEKLYEAGCRVLMPWASPIGSGQGIRHADALRRMRAHFPDAVLVVDAGLGAPSHAAAAMELGFDAVLLNTAVAMAHDPALMAAAFRDAVRAGRQGHLAGLMRARDFAVASTPTAGLPLWHDEALAGMATLHDSDGDKDHG